MYLRLSKSTSALGWDRTNSGVSLPKSRPPDSLKTERNERRIRPTLFMELFLLVVSVDVSKS